ncbi:hypothetical protein H0H81_000730 [Sphagnurus paluster]|uniref:Uncharacterized protein n=1 Tax=Sphagnurus paluster TaxID=117069 RepID=A0A9P7FTI4_9AGAR|nr:hypothetical protein H0H81_000730 [Sphagnurus paluster]
MLYLTKPILGYSVFAVTQADPSAPLQLPRTEADEVASTLPEPRSAAHPGSQTSADRPLASGSSYTQNRPAAIEGLEDEDYELQAALQASLAGGHGGHDAFVPSLIPPRTSVPLPLEDDESPIHSSRSDTGAHSLTDDSQSSAHTGQDHPDKGLDPVEASLQRNKLMLQRMRAEQEYAQRELWGEGTSAEDVAALEARRAERQRQEEEEAEHLRRAIEESEALARIEGHMPHDDGDEGMDIEGVDVAPEGMRQQAPSARDISNRVYDDDDAELQAALKASLEQVPQGWEFPELARTYPHLLSSNPPSATSHSKHDRDMEDAESILSTEVEDHISSDAAAEAVSVDELRRRRLARFGI